MTSSQTSASVDRYRVVIPTAFYVPAFLGGGPIQTLKALIEESPENFDTKVICANHDLGETAPLVERPNEWHTVGRADVRYVQDGMRPLVDAFRATSDADVVYLNSLFNPTFSLLPLALRSLGWWKDADVLVAPRGELYPGALAQKPRKKQLFLRAFKALGLPKKVVWHASTEDEAQQIRALFGADSRIAVRENETSLPRAATQRQAREQGPLRLVFASRLHPKKGLDILLTALAEVTEPVEVRIVGAFADDEYEQICDALVRELPENVSVRFCGGLPREEVLAEMRHADMMAFPTTGENFGHVIAEALSESCPVMCSENTPWTETLTAGGGVAVAPNSPEAWTAELNGYAARGAQAWADATDAAGVAYDAWRNAPKGRHVFELVRQQSVRI
ncbi:group 1 glycosyl transferase [Corynebacterium maris DSM 45190]|uniref:Group 1 glycosyl transferase n=1 Tax=Corynebacterium maris DSM 45190 TaxID=1224163 RepID=S5TKB0_9CORY|nr:glycosyltransferase [Corynebacterium maris]AGS35336.1 group 1 glycosyl transferase [Corynebacterium maris DSM 45190]